MNTTHPYTLLIIFSLVLIVGCNTATTPDTPATDQPTTTAVPPTSVTTALINDDEIPDLLADLRSSEPTPARAAITRILDANDQRFIAVFIELFRAGQIGLIRNVPFGDYIDALETLSGQSLGPDWPAWVEWYGKTDLTPPPGFTSWKGRILSLIDPGFGEFLQDRHPVTIRVEEVQWGGVRVDGIPALDNPTMLTAVDADYMNPEDVVFGMVINDEARAYPLRIIDWHEMVNDIIGGVPVSIAYCTLCGAAVAYDGRASDGTTYNFGSSGFLFRSNKLMYDRQTRTLWNQLTGEPVLGELVDTNVTLTILPIVLTTWADWQSQHPETLVLDIETGFPRDYTPGAAYGGYFAADTTMFPVWQRNDLLDTKDQIYALRLDGIPKAYPLERLTNEKVVNDRLGDTDVVLIAPGEILRVDGLSLRSGPATYNAGSEVRAYDRGTYTFDLDADTHTLLDENGRVWQITEEALVGPDGEMAPRLGGHLAYWFGWFAFFPNTLVYGE